MSRAASSTSSWVRAALTVGALASFTGCGYRAQYADAAGEKLHVTLVSARVADAIAGDEVVSGVRDALAREGALAAGQGWPRVEIEVLRADETSDAVAAGADDAPHARATEVGVVARAWIVRKEGASREADTGDVRAFDVVASPGVVGDANGGTSTLVGESVRHDDALRAVARRVGRRIGMRVLGHPVSRDEATGEMW